jgi:hypothetical protein
MEDYLGFDDDVFDSEIFKTSPISTNFKNFLRNRKE